MQFQPPDDWTRLRSIDAHTAGEPLRVVIDGFPEPPGDTMLAKRRHAQQHLDGLRTALMLEPRGHADMYGCVLTEPVTDDGDVGVLFMHNAGFSTMCGHGIIGLVTVGIECGRLAAEEPLTQVRIDTPAGRVTAWARVENGRVGRVTFHNVPSFVLERDLEVDVPGHGAVRCDIAFGGAFYAYVDAAAIGLPLTLDRYGQILDTGRRIKEAVAEGFEIVHPTGDEELNLLYGVIFVQMLGGEIHSRNVCVFADGEVDRSPTGTGVSGRVAIHHDRGELDTGETIVIESILGTTFEVRVVEPLLAGSVPGVLPEVTGRAFITGRHEFLLDPEDPLRRGVLLR